MSDRHLAELLGLAKGLLCDGNISPAEANALCQWLVSNPEALDGPPCDAVGSSLVRMLDDSTLDQTESAEIKMLLRELVKGLEARERERNHPERAARSYQLRNRES